MTKGHRSKNLDIIYITRPQVERWPEELLRRYAPSMRAAKIELEQRQKQNRGTEAK